MTKTLWTKDFIRITLATSLGAAGGIISRFRQEREHEHEQGNLFLHYSHLLLSLIHISEPTRP